MGEVELAALIVRECATLTPELEMKWAALAPEPHARDTAGADRIAAFARAHGKRLRGHTLLWHRSVPAWFEAAPRWDAVAQHIGETMRRYAGIVDGWDVVNEPIAADGMRRSVFLDTFGTDYVARALTAAHEAVPGARLFINEYGLDYANAEDGARRKALLDLVRRLRRARVPLHGIGLQAHLTIGAGEIVPGVLRDFLDALAGEGLAIEITELDVKERDYVLPAARRDALVADHAARYLDAVLPHPAVKALTCWGLSDRQSWLEVTAQDRARFPDAWKDGSTPGLNRGLPYDANLTAKPMRAAMIAAMARRRG